MKPSKNISWFRDGRWSLAFKDGKLYEFENSHVLVMSAWPNPRAWFKNQSHGWQPNQEMADKLLSRRLFPASTPTPPEPEKPFVLPNGQMILPGVEVGEEKVAKINYNEFMALEGYSQNIPAEVRNELLRFDKRKWYLLNAFARCPGAVDLSKSNPALFYALANHWLFHDPAVRDPVRAMRSLVWKKQRLIQEWLGFPGTEAARRTLARIMPRSLDIEVLLFLRRAIGKQAAQKLLSHAPVLDRCTVRIICDRRTRPHITPRFLQDMTAVAREKCPAGMTVYDMLKATVRMAAMVGWKRCPRSFASFKRLYEVYKELATKTNAEKFIKEFQLPERFENPPYAGNSDIIPLTSVEEMFKEGYEQRNCCGQYSVDVAYQQAYVYRVLRPIRATLSFCVTKGSWEPGLLLKACNKPVDREMRCKVFSTLARTRRLGSWANTPKPAATA